MISLPSPRRTLTKRRHPSTLRSRHRGTRGLTLIELVITVGILILVVATSVAGLGRMSSVQLRTQTNKLAAALRHAYNRSVAHGLYVRMVVDIDADAYWVEASAEPIFLPAEKRDEPGDPQVDEEEEERRRMKRGTSRIARRDNAPPPRKRTTYQQDGVIPRVNMERGIGIAGVITLGQSDFFTSGKAYIHFFPNGWVEPTMIHTTDGQETYNTLTISPLTGRVRNRPGKLDPERDFGEPTRTEEEGGR